MTNEMQPLTDDEAALLYHVGRWGSDGYPIERIGRSWHWRQWLSVRGAPVVYRTKRAAVAAFEGWCDLARARLGSDARGPARHHDHGRRDPATMTAAERLAVY